MLFEVNMTDNKFYLDAKFEFLEDDSTEKGEAFSAISLNPFFQWAKIVVTDDLPNANRMRIPQSEFENIIKTGINAPIKMAQAEISPGHKEAFGQPIGVITNLTKESNKIIALAALWKKERPEDIAKLKDMYLNGNPPNVSWEVSYTESSYNDEGIEELLGTSLDGLAIVGLPAYRGRTSFVAMSSEDQNKSDKESVTLEEIEQLKQENEQLKQEIANLKSTNESLEGSLNTAKAEAEELKAFKDNIEKDKADAEKLNAIKAKFEEAGISKEENYFVEKKDTLLGLADEELDFMIQEIAAFSKTATSSDNNKGPKIPDLKNTDNEDQDLSDPKNLAKALKELRAKK